MSSRIWTMADLTISKCWCFTWDSFNWSAHSISWATGKSLAMNSTRNSHRRLGSSWYRRSRQTWRRIYTFSSILTMSWLSSHGVRTHKVICAHLMISSITPLPMSTWTMITSINGALARRLTRRITWPCPLLRGRKREKSRKLLRDLRLREKIHANHQSFELLEQLQSAFGREIICELSQTVSPLD